MSHLVWHDLECGGYDADLPLWRWLAGRERGPVLDVGAGAGRVALALGRQGVEVVALDHDPLLLEALRERAAGLPVSTARADARDFELGRRFGLILAPMQTVQLLEGNEGRAAFLRCAAAHLAPGGLVAAAVAEELDAYSDALALPAPDVDASEGWTWRSHPIAVRDEGGRVAIERVRETIAPDGGHSAERDVVRLDRISAIELEAQARAAGLRPLRRRVIPPTEDYIGSTVVMLRACD
jgi:SAM-dependent methyltransferase